MAEFPTAEAGEKLVRIKVGDKWRLQVVGSNPPAFRSINVDRLASLKVNGHPTPLMWIIEAGGGLVSVPWQKTVVKFSELPSGTEIEVVGYEYSESELQARLVAEEKEKEERRRSRWWV